MSDLIERSARYLAGKGDASVSQHLTIAKRAGEMLANGEVAPSRLAQTAPIEQFAWQLEEPSQATPRGIWSASVEETLTGEGIVGHFVIGLFRGEAEIRQRLAAEVGVWLANAALVRGPFEAQTPDSLFVTQAVFAALKKMAHDPLGPGEASYIARYSVNYS